MITKFSIALLKSIRAVLQNHHETELSVARATSIVWLCMEAVKTLVAWYTHLFGG